MQMALVWAVNMDSVANNANDNDIKEALLQATIIKESHYSLNGIQLVWLQHFFISIYPNLTDVQFWSLFRATRTGFKSLVKALQHNAVFSNNSWNWQADPSIRIAVALCHLGSNGNGGSLARIQAMFDIGSGMVVAYTAHVVRALIDLAKQYIIWPDAEQWREIGQVMCKEGFPACVGFIDGTTIPLSQKPTMDGKVYYDRKKR